MTRNCWSGLPAAAIICLLWASALPGADWNQWRGPNRDGVARQSPPLLSTLPDAGLMPAWVSDEKIPSSRDGGWGSPIVADGRVFLFAHTREKMAAKDLPKRKYPWLAPDKRGHLTAEQYQQYEVNRRDEDEKFSKVYQFREIVYCLDAATGKTLWKNVEPSVYTRFVQSGTLAEHRGRLYLQGADRTVRCVDAETGRSLWRTRVPGEFRDQFYMSSFAVADGVAVGLVGHLVGIDAGDGKLLWQGDADKTKGTHASPIVWRQDGSELVIVNVNGSQTICIEPKTGRERWRVASEAGNSTPVLAGVDRMITFGSSRKRGLRCFRISPTSAEYLWTYHGAGDPGSSPVVVGDHVYVQGERNLACVDLASGQETWKTMLQHKDPRFTSLLAADGKIFYAAEGMLCFAADASGFRPVFEAKVDRKGLLASERTHRRLLGLDQIESQPDGFKKAEKLYRSRTEKYGPLKCTTPAFSGGRLYIRTPDGVACYDLRQSPPQP